MNAYHSRRPLRPMRLRPESPVMSLFREWLHLRQVHEQTTLETSDDDPAREVSSDAVIAIERRIAAAGAASERDWIAKICAVSNFGANEVATGLRPGIWAEAQDMFAETEPKLPGLPLVAPGDVPDTDILRLFRLHAAIRTAARDFASIEGEADAAPDVCEMIYQITDAIEDQMVSLPSSCAADMAAKMIVRHVDGELSCLGGDDPVWLEARKLTGVGP